MDDEQIVRLLQIINHRLEVQNQLVERLVRALEIALRIRPQHDGSDDDD